MQGQEHLMETATQFLSMAEKHFREMKQETGVEMNVIVPMSKEDFDKTLAAISLIKKMAAEKKMKVELMNWNEAKKEYGHTRCFCVSRIS